MQEEGFTLSVLEEGKDMMKKREVTLIGDRRRLEKEEPRVEFGISLLETALKETGYGCLWAEAPEHPWEYRLIPGEKLYVGIRKEEELMNWLEEEEVLCFHSREPEGEGFYLQRIPGKMTVVCGGSASGALYGCLKLAELLREEKELPAELNFYDAPAFKLRGPCVGLQKTKLEPPRHTYEYPITPDRFPWFYDKKMWQEFLDSMLRERCNVLYIWSGHPFASLVKVPDYPEALEVTPEEYEKNRELFGWLTRECDRRGIWVVLKFYNIHISLPFALAHGLDLNQSNIHPLVADYTYKSIVEFVKTYPHIGLMVCLGEALRGTQNKTDWFARTIIPAVKQGAKEAGLKEEPPVILRGHDCDPVAAMEAVSAEYTHLYTMWKYNGESLTTYLPRGNWQQLHKSLSALGGGHIMNVHILANLEPFRFMAPGFIQKCVQAGSERLGANGLHLYPLFYWDWPYSPDKSEKRLTQLHRDWLWYEAWFRYAWNPWRPEEEEKEYWKRRLACQYGMPEENAGSLLKALEAMGLCAPKILGRVGITEGNRQTMSLGMTMSQLTNVIKYRPNRELWHSVAAVGEQPDDYWRKEKEGLPHVGETPFDLVEDLEYLVECMDKNAAAAARCSVRDPKGLQGILDDCRAVKAMTLFYCWKIKAAMNILAYKYGMDERCLGELGYLEEAQEQWEQAMEWYRKLTALTKETYLYANSMQTPQRKIPFPNGETYGHWTQCLPEYEKEFRNFKANVEKLKNGWIPVGEEEETEGSRLPEAEFTLEGKGLETYTLKKGEYLFTDSDSRIQNIAPEIQGLTGIRFGMGEAIVTGITIKLTLAQDSKILIGYFDDKGVEWLQVPELETNTHADDRGGLAVLYANALKAQGCKAVHIHAFSYEKGTHEIYLGTGAFIVAGVIPEDAPVVPRNAGLEGEGMDTLDWMYE